MPARTAGKLRVNSLFQFTSLPITLDRVRLELKTCTIRSWSADDAASVQRYADNRKIWINLRDIFPFPYTLEKAGAFLNFVIQQKPETTFALATASEAIGCIGLQFGHDVHRKTAELG